MRASLLAVALLFAWLGAYFFGVSAVIDDCKKYGKYSDNTRIIKCEVME